MKTVKEHQVIMKPIEEHHSLLIVQFYSLVLILQVALMEKDTSDFEKD